ncbi:UbiH/UbiF/VisC/COQ6 family ubiquinone biosynthesis hydroxylase [Sphingomonas sp. CFBP 13720]|uniref:UbiH/UbiF/VisC/COQ6 family ubiquinone biosynthesis hydroxylase n=1 Tax=Sphingomonas sp. CFBP 13720 TaxID=2775302 RepID=UPI00177BBBDA|nr:UbiH/UbiF/VisC/COQ6 family ubiquinone biosynthesis hydroxylase [Sphingomonas sp. CFBP 13720]MBD8678506.1 UbiH/UbiF/VisC/COQ6 family ubiquinone biosynthesis hydroxylase [Sphingomonas sp. CFBP 13720]
MTQADVIILGGGLVGSTLGVSLAAHGLSAIILDPADPAVTLAPGFDGRASAIASATHRMFDAIGITPGLAGEGCPIAAIRATDGLAPGKLDFIPDAADDPVGVMYENKRLRRAIFDAATASTLIDLRYRDRAAAVERGATGVTVTTGHGDAVTAPLLIAAEGRNSPTREAAGIRVARWSYDHAAIITTLGHEHPHENVAYEIFYPAGPFAILPLNDDEHGRRSAIVWTVDAKDRDGMLKLSDRAFLAEASKKMGGFLGTLSNLSARSSYPLGFHHAARITADRLVLVGDAAHGIHPIAGQGLNLGLRDVAALTEILVEGKRTGMDLGDPYLLERYQRWRGLDTFSVALATDGLTRLFGIPGKTASAVRRFGLSAVDAIAPLKAAFMAEARGETGNMPKLLQGVTV